MRPETPSKPAPIACSTAQLSVADVTLLHKVGTLGRLAYEARSHNLEEISGLAFDLLNASTHFKWPLWRLQFNGLDLHDIDGLTLQVLSCRLANSSLRTYKHHLPSDLQLLIEAKNGGVTFDDIVKMARLVNKRQDPKSLKDRERVKINKEMNRPR